MIVILKSFFFFFSQCVDAFFLLTEKLETVKNMAVDYFLFALCKDFVKNTEK